MEEKKEVIIEKKDNNNVKLFLTIINIVIITVAIITTLNVLSIRKMEEKYPKKDPNESSLLGNMTSQSKYCKYFRQKINVESTKKTYLTLFISSILLLFITKGLSKKGSIIGLFNGIGLVIVIICWLLSYPDLAECSGALDTWGSSSSSTVASK